MKADTDAARLAARKLLDELSIKTPPVPVDRIIKGRGIALHYTPLDETLSGMAYIKAGESIIGINALHHPNRQRFSAAHELGHHILHRPEITDMVHVDKGNRALFRNEVSSMGVDPIEIEANAFASELLMPFELLVVALEGKAIDLDDDMQIEALARKFRVSASAMGHRLAILQSERNQA